MKDKQKQEIIEQQAENIEKVFKKNKIPEFLNVSWIWENFKS